MKAAKKQNVSLKNEIYERGLVELRYFIGITRTSPQLLESAQRDLEALPETIVQQLIALGLQQLKERLDLVKVENNYRHVEDQLLRPVIEDADFLLHTFAIDPTRLRLLVVLHDLGKVEIPADMWEVLNYLYPDDYVAREILTHEYASMHWIAKLGEILRLSSQTVLSLQRLIANHNFGPNLILPRNKHLLNNWWPARFRDKIMPILRDLDFDMNKLYDKTPDGQHQYYHAEDNVYASLLSAYDRAIATKFNTFGLQTWQKFAEQDYNTWVVANSAVNQSPLRATALTEKMEMAALWARTEIEAMWRVLGERHVCQDLRGQFKLEDFVPYQKQVEAVEKLLRAIAAVKNSNVTEAAGRLLYRTKDGDLYRVDDKAQDLPEQKAKLFWWDNATNSWFPIAEDRSPIKLYFEIIRGDL